VKRVITITGWQRPELFHGLLKSLAANDLRGWQIFLQLEPGEYSEAYCAAAAELLSGVPLSITVNPERLGVRMNPYNLLSRVFEEKADFVLYLEEDLLLAPDATALAQWYGANYRSEWMCLSLLSGGCGSKGFISEPNHPELLFAGKSFNSLGFAFRRNEWELHIRPAWLSDQIVYTCYGQGNGSWDWSVYLHVVMTEGLYTLQPAAARATHTGRYGMYCRPEFHDAAFTGLDLAEESAADRSYHVLTLDSMPPHLRRQASLWDQVNNAFRLLNERSPQLNLLLREREAIHRLSVLWAFRMFLGRDPEPDDYKAYLTAGADRELIERMRASEEFKAVIAQRQMANPPESPVDSMPNSQEAVIWAYVFLLQKKPENQGVIDYHSKWATVGELRRVMLRTLECKEDSPASQTFDGRR
jgi:hypothetical protein